MIKRVKSIYAAIFLAALLLSLASIKDYILTVLDIKWASFVLSVLIMILAIWGYNIATVIQRTRSLGNEKAKAAKKGKKKK